MRVFTYERAGAVVLKDGHVLLMSMEPPGQPRWWHFPGGGIEPGETPREAAIRELHEETGIRAVDAVEFLRAGIHGGHHEYFVMTCDELEIGEVTGPELEYAADADFKAEWVPIADLPRLSVWPRCVAEQLAWPPSSSDGVPWVEDDRHSWEGVPGATPPTDVRNVVRAVLFDGERRRVAAIERIVAGDRYYTLPGGGIDPGETAEDALVREVAEELGVRVTAGVKVAVVVFRRDGATSLQTYLTCDLVGGEFGTGSGDEFTEERRARRGSYRAVWLDVDDLPVQLRPAWLSERLGAWAEEAPDRPARFCEIHDE